MQIQVTQEWYKAFPGAHIGVLLMGNVDNSKGSALLDQEKKSIETRLHQKFAGFSRNEFSNIDVISAYRNYYKRFKKSYHVQLQIESIVLKNMALPNVSPLVDANFMAEMDTLVLTAGHDADLLIHPVRIDVTKEDDSFIQMSGKATQLKPGDMMMADNKGVVCTIIYGQDQRTPISFSTRRALYVAYAPVGVAKEKVREQLDLIIKYVIAAAPKAVVEIKEIHGA
ncbi:MAG: phenylalanine--tRNA ligase beta subunit-related protein [Desulfobacula sp.]